MNRSALVHALASLTPAVLVLLSVWSDLRRKRMRREQARAGLSDAQVERWPLTHASERLDALPACPPREHPDHARFAQALEAFVANTTIEGAQGMIVLEAVRTRLAATAAMMSCRLGPNAWSSLRLLRVYPHSVPVGKRPAGGRTRVSAHGELQVEVGYWQVLASAQDPSDGYDVMVHELAHVLDGSDGSFDGVPRAFVTDGPAFEHALDEAAELLLVQSELSALPLRHRALLSRAELFAVASEAYFECPEVLCAHVPALHGQLGRLYGPGWPERFTDPRA